VLPGGAIPPGGGVLPGGAMLGASSANADVTRYEIESNVNIINANENRVIFFIKSLGG
jgi:hypothetical protein